MKLSDIQPKSLDFEIRGVKLTFRPYRLADHAKTEKMFSSKEIKELLDSFDFEKLSVLAWYQLDLKSQKLIIESVEGTYLDPHSGLEIEANLSPLEKLKTLCSSMLDQMALLRNLFNCHGLNMPEWDDGEGRKKWTSQVDKMVKSTGLKYLIK